MQLDIRTEIDIDAAADRVWAVLTDFAAYAQWNPFVRAIAGVPRVGERLRVSLQPPGGKAMTFRPVVRVAEPGRELRWLGRLVLPGVFDGEHHFRLQPLGAGRTRFIHGEHFSGWLVGLAKASLTGPTQAGFVLMNQALKARAEQGCDAPPARAPGVPCAMAAPGSGR